MIQHRRTMNIPILSDWTDLQMQSAKKLLAYGKRTTERTILNEISHLLRLLGITEIESETTVSAGRMDIYCYRLRTIIETKKVGKARIDVLDQLEPYIHAKILEDFNELPFEIPEEQNRSWTGIITDGQVWHVWKYPNTTPPPPPNEAPHSCYPQTPENLLEFLTQEIFADKPLGKPRIPQNPYALFVDDLQKLTEIYDGLNGRPLKETETKFDLWRDMLRASGMEPESESRTRDLFIKHSFLVSTARNVAHILTSPNPEKDSHNILADGFVSWIVQDTDGDDWQKAFLQKINSYDWRRQKGDVLRSVYERFILAKDRKIFGEHYTPDWLAELLVNETLDPKWCEQSIKAANSQLPLKGVGVLDPACGSGTFLYHAARTILESETMKSLHLPLPRQAEITVKLIHGIDIHPIAAEISKATLLRALPASPPDGAKSVNVWQGDSLMTFQSKEDDSRPILNMMTHEIRQKNVIFSIPGSRSPEIRIPLSFCESLNFNLDMERLIFFAKRNSVPTDILQRTPQEDRATLEECCKNFTQIISEKGNSVWAWYITNITAPMFLSKRKVNRIVANPPWVPMKEIQIEYRKAQLEQTFKTEDLWQGGKQASNNDIAQLFPKMCRRIYLHNPQTNPASWIVKKSYIKSAQWKKFREYYKAHGIEKHVLDLQKVNAFGSGDAKRACVLFDLHSSLQTNPLIPLQNHTFLVAKKVDSKQKIQPFMRLKDALPLLEFDAAPKKIPEAASFYSGKNWTMGAPTRPDVLVVIEKIDKNCGDLQNITVTTRKSIHHPWKTLSAQTGAIPKDWACRLYKATDFYPFILSKHPSSVILPLSDRENLEPDPCKKSKFWSRLEKIYSKHKTRKAPATLIKMINRHNCIAKQLSARTSSKIMVIYPASGDVMKSTRVFSQAFQQSIIGEKCYFQKFSSPQEAAYLVSLMNAPCMNDAFIESRKSGRDFHKYIWDKIPIPEFNPENPDHSHLAKLCEEAEAAVQDWYDSDPEHSTYSQIKTSNRIRELLKNNKISDRIDEIVRRMLPNQAT